MLKNCIKYQPTSFPGRWAVRTAYLSVFLIVLSLAFAAMIGGNPAVIARNRIFSLIANTLSLVFSLSIPLAWLLGIYAIIRHKERAVWKPLLLLQLITFSLLLLGEFLFKH